MQTMISPGQNHPKLDYLLRSHRLLGGVHEASPGLPLLAVAEGELVRFHPLADGLRGGRATDAAVSLADDLVSERHFVIQRRGAEWWISDEGSTNGVWVNGVKLAEKQLRAGDYVVVGRTEMAVWLPPRDLAAMG